MNTETAIQLYISTNGGPYYLKNCIVIVLCNLLSKGRIAMSLLHSNTITEIALLLLTGTNNALLQHIMVLLQILVKML